MSEKIVSKKEDIDITINKALTIKVCNHLFFFIFFL